MRQPVEMILRCYAQLLLSVLFRFSVVSSVVRALSRAMISPY